MEKLGVSHGMHIDADIPGLTKIQAAMLRPQGYYDRSAIERLGEGVTLDQLRDEFKPEVFNKAGQQERDKGERAAVAMLAQLDQYKLMGVKDFWEKNGRIFHEIETGLGKFPDREYAMHMTPGWLPITMTQEELEDRLGKINAVTVNAKAVQKAAVEWDETIADARQAMRDLPANASQADEEFDATVPRSEYGTFNL